MSDVALVALFSASATVFVAVVGLIGTVFGPAKVERARTEAAIRQERNAEIRRAEAERFARAERLSAAWVEAIGASDWKGYAQLDEARMRFIAVLQPGEGKVAQFIAEIGDDTNGNPNAFVRKKSVLDDMTRIFAWLRGDISIDELVYRPGNQAASPYTS